MTDSIETSEREAIAPFSQPVIDSELPNDGPRVTPNAIEDEIASQHFFTAAQGDAKALEDAAFVNGSLDGAQLRAVPAELGLLTICVLVLRNGFTIIGKSACTSPENFRADIGRRIAREDAVSQIWPFLGFRLRDRLADDGLGENPFA